MLPQFGLGLLQACTLLHMLSLDPEIYLEWGATYACMLA